MAEDREAAMAEMLEANATLRAELQAALMRQVRHPLRPLCGICSGTARI
jgi:hypothetical protein